MKIAQFSDWHRGITTDGQIKVQLKEMAKPAPDILINCGDNTGTTVGWRCTKVLAEMVRDVFPTTPILWTNGNHDLWCAEPKKKQRFPAMKDFDENLKKIQDILREQNIHYLDKDGVYQHPDFPKIFFMGAMGWYNNPNPPTNDCNFLPYGVSGSTNRHILLETEKDVWRNEEGLTTFDLTRDQLVFISHFPVVKVGEEGDWKGSFEDFSWNEGIARHFQEFYNCKYFLNGHAHALHQGPLRWESGSDYKDPKFQIIKIGGRDGDI